MASETIIKGLVPRLSKWQSTESAAFDRLVELSLSGHWVAPSAEDSNGIAMVIVHVPGQDSTEVIMRAIQTNTTSIQVENLHPVLILLCIHCCCMHKGCPTAG